MITLIEILNVHGMRMLNYEALHNDYNPCCNWAVFPIMPRASESS
jgi:hypothetical protein